MSATPFTLPAEAASALREAFAMLRKAVADPDLKVALKASAELGKLITTCSRAGVELPPDAPAGPPPSADTEAIRRKKADTLTAVFDPRQPDGRFDPPVSRSTEPVPPPRSSVPGGKQLHSFLGTPKPATQTAAPIRPPSPG